MLSKEDLNDIKTLAKEIIAIVDTCNLTDNYSNSLIQDLKDCSYAIDEIVNEKKHTIEKMF